MLSTKHIPDLKLALSCIDHTRLEATDTHKSIQELCNSAVKPAEGLPSVAGVCVYPNWITHAKACLKQYPSLRITSVASCFPSGASFMQVRELETRMAVEAGADEIDVVISRGAMLEGHSEHVRHEIRQFRALTSGKILKVILETGELQSPQLIKEASWIAMEEGADFIKTSTGKISPAATVEAAEIMIQAIADFYAERGRKVGFKPAGGIRTAEEALTYIALMRKKLSEDWLHADLFRFGASSLTTNLVKAIQQLQSTGSYQTNGNQQSSAY